MAIKVRRGNKADLVIANLVAGEPAFALDTKEFGIKANDGTMVWVGTLNANGKVNQDALNALSLGGISASTIIDSSGNAQNALKLGNHSAVEYPLVSSGNWAPTLCWGTTAGNITLTTSLGRYYKIGKIVFLSCYIAWSALSEASGELYVGGLPFVNGDSNSALMPMVSGSFTTLDNWIHAEIRAGSSNVNFFGTGFHNISELSPSGWLAFSGCYQSV